MGRKDSSGIFVSIKPAVYEAALGQQELWEKFAASNARTTDIPALMPMRWTEEPFYCRSSGGRAEIYLRWAKRSLEGREVGVLARNG